MSHAVPQVQSLKISETHKSKAGQAETRPQAVAKHSGNKEFSVNLSSELNKRQRSTPRSSTKQASTVSDNAGSGNAVNDTPRQRARQHLTNKSADSPEQSNRRRDSVAANQSANPAEPQAQSPAQPQDQPKSMADGGGHSLPGSGHQSENSASMPDSADATPDAELQAPTIEGEAALLQPDTFVDASDLIAPRQHVAVDGNPAQPLLLPAVDSAGNTLNPGAGHSVPYITATPLSNAPTVIHNPVDNAAANALFQQRSPMVTAVPVGVNGTTLIENGQAMSANNMTTQAQQNNLLRSTLSGEGTPRMPLTALEATGLAQQQSVAAGVAGQAKNPALVDAQKVALADYSATYSLAASGGKPMPLFGGEYLDRLGVTNPNGQVLKASVMSDKINPLLTNTTESTSLATEADAVRSVALTTRPQSAIGPLTPSNFSIPTPLTNPAWGQDAGQRIYWMVKQNVQQAELQLNPKHLGPMEVKISVGQDQQVNVSIITQQGAVKEALDTAMPRLREMLDNQGLNLGNVNVSDETSRQQQQQTDGSDQNGRVSSPLDEPESPLEATPQTFADLSSQGLVDLYV